MSFLKSFFLRLLPKHLTYHIKIKIDTNIPFVRIFNKAGKIFQIQQQLKDDTFVHLKFSKF